MGENLKNYERNTSWRRTHEKPGIAQYMLLIQEELRHHNCKL